MNWEILSYIFAIALTFSAVVSPIITAKINNKHQLEINKQNNEFQIKLKDLELNFPARDKAFDIYLECLSKYLNHPSSSNLYNYQVSMAKASMYSSKNVRGSLETIDYFINEKNDLQKVSKLISNDLSSSMYKENIKKST